MNFINNNIVRLVLCLSVIVLAACSTEPRQRPIEGAPDYVRRENQPAFTVPEPYAAMKHNAIRIDLNRDGYDDAVLTVMAGSVPDAQAVFDSVFVFEYVQSSDSFERRYAVPVFYGTTVETLDLDNDEHPEVLVYTDAGGNDPIVGNGLTVVRFAGGSYATALQLDGGDPEIATFDAAGKPLVAVKVFSDFWPDQLSHAESVRFLDSLIVLRTVSDSVRVAVEQQVFRKALEEAERDYATSKNAYAERQDDEAAYGVYNAAVRSIQYYRRLGMDDRIKTFRAQELKFWRGAMPPANVNILNQLATPESSS